MGMFSRTIALEDDRGQEQGPGMEVPAMEVLEKGQGFLVNFSMPLKGVMALSPNMLRIPSPSTLKRQGGRDTKERLF
jgi:hypothetical protein